MAVACDLKLESWKDGSGMLQKRFPGWNGYSFSNIVLFVKDKNVSFAIGSPCDS